ncbi:MAG: branched-chain amino acid ABC transporter permease [Methylobacteriaceae bacterium]|nr:branched-chain amino acid ABC transporter permease [Methylobacteriaceae bacterium]
MSALGKIAPWIILAILLAVAPLVFTSGTSRTMLSIMALSIIFALSYNMLLGQTGLLSFGHAVYYGLGGFVAIHAMNTVIRNKYAIPLPVIPLIGGAAGLFFGIVFGSVSTRRAGTVFSMISLGLGELVASSALILRTFFGGEEGITTNRSRLAPFFGYKFGPQIEVYYLIACWCFVCILLMYAITRTPFGRMCNAVRENPERAEFVGYSARMVRFIAFSLAGLFAGIAGGLAALNFEIMNTQSIGAVQSGLVLLMTFVGGAGVFFGPIIGAVLITFLQITLSDVTGAWQLYFGLMFILVVMYSPGGIAGWLALHEPLYRGRQLGRLIPAYLINAVPLVVMIVGGILLIELADWILVKAETEGPGMSVFGIVMNSNSIVPWIIAIILFFGGAFALRATWPRVQDAWGVALARLREQPA